MKPDLSQCPLVSYLEQSPQDGIDHDVFKPFLDAARSGEPDALYGYALLLFETAHNEDMYPFAKALPADIKDAMDKKSFEVFYYAASLAHAESALMTGYLLLVGQGTDQDTHSAKLFHAQAKITISEKEPRMRKFAQVLKELGEEEITLEGLSAGFLNAKSPAPAKPNPSNKSRKNETISIEKADLAKALSPLSAPPEKIDNMYLRASLNELKYWVIDGFKNEDDKGALYNTLINAVDALDNVIAASNDQKTALTVQTDVLELLNIASCQINEAALHIGGVAPKDRNIFLPNLGMGHAPEEQKHMGAILREVRENFTQLFDKYGIASYPDAELDKHKFARQKPSIRGTQQPQTPRPPRYN